jgi:hypothetical protein
VAEGNAQFCGEHTAQNARGYMEGAVTSGERVVGELAGAGITKRRLADPGGQADAAAFGAKMLFAVIFGCAMMEP